MIVQQFLAHLNKYSGLPTFSVICFYGSDYPLLFFSHLFSFLNKKNKQVTIFDALGIELSLVKAHIGTMSFAGSAVYWIGNIHALPTKKQQEWIEYVHAYTGPHTVLFFSTEKNTAQLQLEKQDNSICVALDNHIPAHDYALLRFLVADNAQQEKSVFMPHIGFYTQQMSLDSACLFAHYEVVVGKSVDDFFREWVPQIIEPTHSLFLLSQYFFAKKSKLFFKQWQHSVDLYAPSFWVSFWADQIWKAYMYSELMQKKEYALAKRAQYKLPYSLVNRDWSSLKLRELQAAYQFLSTTDFRLKNGGSAIALELFYSTFFENKFRSF